MLCSSLVIVESRNDHCLLGISYNTNMIIKWFKLFQRGVIFLNQFNALLRQSIYNKLCFEDTVNTNRMETWISRLYIQISF
jgi:hypothetical protein